MKDLPKNLHAAIAYTRLGWKVFAIRSKSKAPLTLHGFQDATTDISVLQKWWNKNPACGVGIATGNKSGILVVDIDPRNGGDETAEALELEHGPFPPTVEAQTGGGGRHLIYKLPKGVFPGVKNLWPGVDIKSDGGYIVAPYSVHPNGFEYKWIIDHEPKVPGEKGGIKPAKVPQWLLDTLLKKRESQVRSTKERATDDKYFPEGKRNDALTSLAGTMRRRAMTPSAILAALLAENEVKCAPPLPDCDVQQIVNSVCRYESDPQADPGISKKASEGRLLEWVDTVKIASEEAPPVTWLLPGWLAKRDCAILFGPPGVGKSWVTLDIAVTLASGKDTFGVLKHEGEIFKVLLIDEENPPEEAWRRLHCIVKAWEIAPQTLQDQLYLTKPRQGFTFRDESYIFALQKEIEKIKPDLVILDSITALSSIKKENDAVEVRAFFHDKLYPLQKISECAFLCVHHSTKGIYQTDPKTADEGLARGSVDFVGAADSVMMLKPVKGKNFSFLKSNKVRRGKKPDKIQIKIVDGVEGGCRPMGNAKLTTPSRPSLEGSEFPKQLHHTKQEAEIAPCVERMLREQDSVELTSLPGWVKLTLPHKSETEIAMVISKMRAKGEILIANGQCSINPRK